MNFVFYLHDEQDLATFERKVLWFKSRYQLISQQELHDCIIGKSKLKNSCHLTVDDGWRSTYDVIFPVLKKYQIPFSIFVSPEIVRTGKNFWYYTMKNCDEDILKHMLVEKSFYKEEAVKYPFDLLAKEIPTKEIYALLDEYKQINHLTENRGFINNFELLEMHASGLVEVGAHTLSHPILANESSETSKQEIQQSVILLSEMLGHAVKSFAYPNGLYGPDFTDREISYVKECGVELAFSVDPGYLTSRVNPLAIPRVGSESRLKLGRLGCWLPSVTNQAGIRKKIKSLLR